MVKPVNWFGFEREKLKEKVIEMCKKKHYDEDLTQDELEIVNLFEELSCVRREATQSVENFFDLLDILIYYTNKRGEYAENH